jgi:hypothetical protein
MGARTCKMTVSFVRHDSSFVYFSPKLRSGMHLLLSDLTGSPLRKWIFHVWENYRCQVSKMVSFLPQIVSFSTITFQGRTSFVAANWSIMTSHMIESM